MDERRRTAYHEAGHALILHLSGLPVHEARVDAPSPGIAGLVRPLPPGEPVPEPTGAPLSPAAARVYCVVQLGGIAGELVGCGDASVPHDGPYPDLDRVWEALRELSPRALAEVADRPYDPRRPVTPSLVVELALREACGMLQQPAVRRKLDRLATALARCGRLSAWEIRRTLEVG